MQDIIVKIFFYAKKNELKLHILILFYIFAEK